eukprot:TRINITY_DN11541_c0_g1_i1.p1 TRINITY_DN11541_c0_g1~~TRINITY_DN11541_c0_g1_i1.p1  ORF type:complete len:116 (-),score=14.03 TRINITY_DN11541_c0_g1_i1:58-405(-)
MPQDDKEFSLSFLFLFKKISSKEKSWKANTVADLSSSSPRYVCWYWKLTRILTLLITPVEWIEQQQTHIYYFPSNRFVVNFCRINQETRSNKAKQISSLIKIRNDMSQFIFSHQP